MTAQAQHQSRDVVVDRDAAQSHFRLCIAVGGLFVLFHFVALLLPIAKDTRTLIIDLLFPLEGFLAALFMFYASRRSYQTSKRLGLMWYCLTAAVTAWSIGELIWFWYEVVLKTEPWPSPADVFYIAFYPLIITGVFLCPTRALSTHSSAKSLLDGAVIMLAGLVLFANFIVLPHLNAGSSDFMTSFLLVAYPAGGLVQLWSVVLLLYRQLLYQPRLPLLFLLAGLMGNVTADSAFSILQVLGSYRIDDVSGIFYSFAHTCFLLAGASQYLQVGVTAESSPPLSSSSGALEPRHDPLFEFNLARTWLPYLWLFATYAALLLSHSKPQPLNFNVLGTMVGLITALVVVRQILEIHENKRLGAELQRLNTDLEAKVLERTALLEERNQDLRQEIRERKRAEDALREREAQLEHEATHDSLTGLPNRAYLIRRLTQSLEERPGCNRHRLALLFLDCDGFKDINDSLGHHIGDKLLVEVGRRLQLAVSDETLVVRLGGDEFVLVAMMTEGAEQALELAQHILLVLSAPVSLSGNIFYASASIGIVLDDGKYVAPEELLRDADIAMYEAKTQGRARAALFEPSMLHVAASRLSLRTDLHAALKSNQFLLHYQPIYSLTDLRLVGFEALVRWQHPERGLVGPADFVSTAELNGLIVPIGQWVLEEACRQLGSWQRSMASAHGLYMSVNVSARQLNSPELASVVRRVVDESDILPGSLVLEITESAFTDDTSTAMGLLNTFRAQGVRLAIDDFGTGYSSLNYLHRLPVHTLKIDRSFVHRIGVEGENMEIIRTITTLARALHLTLTAEGIESPHHLERLRELGCEQGQGYLFSKPLDAAAATELIVSSAAQRPARILALLEPSPTAAAIMSSATTSQLEIRLEAVRSRNTPLI